MTPSFPTRKNSEVPVAKTCLEFCLWYVNHQKINNWVGTTLVIKVDDILLIYIHLTYFFHWIYDSKSNLLKHCEWIGRFPVETFMVWAPPLKLWKLGNLEVLYFSESKLFWNFRVVGLFFRVCYLLGGTWYFLAQKWNQKQFNFSLVYLCHKDFMKICIFPRIPLKLFLWSLFLCICPEV